jgi:ATP-binding cassette subfamily C protein LapB
VIELLKRAAQLSGQRLQRTRIDAVRKAVEQNDKAPPVVRFMAAWRAAGLIGQPVPIRAPTRADLPMLCWREKGGFALLLDAGPDGRFNGRSEEGEVVTLAPGEEAAFLRLTTRAEVEAVPRALPLITRAVWSHKIILVEAILATFVVSLLALGVSLYSMQVFDRVIPNQGYQTLWVLTAGVAAAILLEWLLKQVRAMIVDATGVEIDKELSQWFFERMQSVRLDARPTTVGTLAAQVKGFETVRAMLTSTSVYVLADVPFAVFFVFVIFVIGGQLALIPMVFLPLALLAGIVFQSGIRRQALRMTVSSYRKNGLLVESVEGAESLKAAHGEWPLAGRWKDLVAEVAEADERIRMYSAWSQNLTALLQQAGYISLIAAGAYLVANNQLTMGGLLAVSIISNRAMTPIVQLPGILVQWAHAQAAISGLDQILALPNEQDRIGERLTPESLEPAVRVERARFSYGLQRTVLEVESLAIGAGEKVGVIGPVGSGKSTLLKIASGLYAPQEGKVFVGGIDASSLHPAVMREAIGYLPQDQRLVSGTLRQNLILGLPDPGDEAILEAAKQTGLFELLAQNPRGLALEISEGGRGVSGGQKQMIALTRIVLARPRLWLLDEPTASMDNDAELRIVRLLRENLGAADTLIVATHKTAFVPILTRLIVVREGKIAMDGPRDAVLATLQGKGQPGGTAVAPVAGGGRAA